MIHASRNGLNSLADAFERNPVGIFFWVFDFQKLYWIPDAKEIEDLKNRGGDNLSWGPVHWAWNTTKLQTYGRTKTDVVALTFFPKSGK